MKPEVRRGLLKKYLEQRKFLRVLEIHNGLSAIKANNISLTKDGEKREFDALWISSFTDSAAKGQPDVEIVSFDSRLMTISQTMDVTTKPILIDGDTGGPPEVFDSLVKRLYNLGASAVIIEDQVFPKRNSLDTETVHHLEDPQIFASKLMRGKKSCPGDDFLIFARIESFIAGNDVEDALKRAEAYLLAGADGIFIHSKRKTPEEVLAFAQEYEKLIERLHIARKPLICVPTTYNGITEQELEKAKFNIVIYANHMLRAAHKAMEEVATSLLLHKRAREAEELCTPVKTIFEEVGFEELKKKEEEFFTKKIRVLIPTGGSHKNLGHLCATKPCSLLSLGTKTVLEYQLHELKKVGIKDVVVIRGMHKEQIQVPEIRYYDADTRDNGILAGIFAAEKEFTTSLLIIYSDIIFTTEIIKRLILEKGDIKIVIDKSYIHSKGLYKSGLERVATEHPLGERQLKKQENCAVKLGKLLPSEEAHAEFVGLMHVSLEGAEILKQLYNEYKHSSTGKFHEAPSFGKAALIDLLQIAIERGHKVNVVEVDHGWRELHTPEDYEKALLELGVDTHETGSKSVEHFK